MPDWTAPIHKPHMTSEKFREMKADYVAKHGYKLTIPGFDDIIDVPVERPMTDEEKSLWKARKYDEIPAQRRDEIEYMKQKRKEKFLAMLADPSPEVLRNRSSILTALDDAEDALSTLSAIGLVAAKVLPRAISKTIAGPVGWTMAGTEALNMIMETQRLGTTPKRSKRIKDDMTDSNPMSKKGRAKLGKKIGKVLPGKGALIEALQTTDQIFGAGVCLGPIFGMPTQIVSGYVREAFMGQSVEVDIPTPDMGHWRRVGQKMLNSVGAFFFPERHTDDEEMARMFLAYQLANQVESYVRDFEPTEEIENISEIEIKAPTPDNPLTLEILEEAGEDPEDSVGWPNTGKKWAKMGEIMDAGRETTADNLRRFCERNKSSWMGMIAADNAVQGSLYGLENMEGKGTVEYDYTAKCKGIHRLLNSGYYVPPDITEEQKTRFIGYLNECEAKGFCPSTKQMLNYSGDILGLEWTTKLPE